jgi:hypothetical protein
VFDPLKLTSEASMNGTLLADLAGAERDWVGQTAMRLTSMPALQARALAAGLGVSTGASGVAHVLEALGSPHAERARRAAAVVGVLGRALGHLIATLKLAPPGAPYPAAPADQGGPPPSAWRVAYLNHWAQVQRVWLGGGLTAALGAFFIDDGRAELERLGVRGALIDLAPNADVLGLIGLARSRLQPPPVNIVLDFGNTSVKRGIALAPRRVLEHLEVLPSRSALPLNQKPDAAAIATLVVESIADTFAEAERRWGTVDPHVTVSLASYIIDGQPLPWSRYGSLQHPVRRQLEAELRSCTGARICLDFMHDGSAAARGLIQPGRAGLIVVGTYLGAGFPPPPAHLAPLADGFTIRRASP